MELTFELPDSAKECFHEIIEKDVEATVEFQVMYNFNQEGEFPFKEHSQVLFLSCWSSD